MFTEWCCCWTAPQKLWFNSVFKHCRYIQLHISKVSVSVISFRGSFTPFPWEAVPLQDQNRAAECGDGVSLFSLVDLGDGHKPCNRVYISIYFLFFSILIFLNSLIHVHVHCKYNPIVTLFLVMSLRYPSLLQGTFSFLLLL